MSLKFEKATENDISAVVGIYDDILKKEQDGLGCTGWIQNVYPTKSTADNALENGELYVCRDNDTVIAAAIINKKQGDMYAGGDWELTKNDSPDKIMVLHTLVVSPKAGKKGVGRQFVEFYEKFASENGCTALRFDTNEKNTVARSFYNKIGYRETGIVPCVFNGIPNVKLVLFEKRV